VAGLRLAALSLAGHPDPERSSPSSPAASALADYLLASSRRRAEDVRRLLLRTSILERLTGALADALVGATEFERILLNWRQANARRLRRRKRTWFRYHELFADLLRLELRRTEPGVI